MNIQGIGINYQGIYNDIYKSAKKSAEKTHLASKDKVVREIDKILKEKKHTLLDYINYIDKKIPLSSEEEGELLSKVLNISEDRFSFYLENKENPQKLLDLINFASDVVVYSYDMRGGWFSIGCDGKGQCIPAYAIGYMNPDTLDVLRATGNVLSLKSKSYYAYVADNGEKCVCVFNNNAFHSATAAKVIGGGIKSPLVKEKFKNTQKLITDLLKGDKLSFKNRSSKSADLICLKELGIVPGDFSIVTDGVTKNYFLKDDGTIIRKE